MAPFHPRFARPLAACAVFVLAFALGAGNARAVDMGSVIGPLPGEVGTPCGPSGSFLPPGFNAPIAQSNTGDSTHATVDGSATASTTKTTCHGGHLPQVVGGSGTVTIPAQSHGQALPPPTHATVTPTSVR